MTTYTGAVTTTYSYDPLGQRVRKTSSGTDTLYIDRYLEIEDPDGSPDDRKYYWLGEVLIARSDAAGLFYFHPDRLGSIRLVTDNTGQVVEEYTYTAFGERTPLLVSGFAEARGYTGHRYDAETGLTYMGARYYEAKIARFLSPDPTVPDPSDSQSLNRYSYARNNPMNRVDPSGLFDIDASLFGDTDLNEVTPQGLTFGGWSDLVITGNPTGLTSAGVDALTSINLPGIGESGGSSLGFRGYNFGLGEYEGSGAQAVGEIVGELGLGAAGVGGGLIDFWTLGLVSGESKFADLGVDTRSQQFQIANFVFNWGTAIGNLGKLAIGAGRAAFSGVGKAFSFLRSGAGRGGLLLDTNVIINSGRQALSSGKSVFKSFVSDIELRSLFRRGEIRGIPNASKGIPSINSLPSIHTRINIRGLLTPGQAGNFADGIIGATAIERNLTLVTSERKLHNLADAVRQLGGTAVSEAIFR